MFFEGDIDLIDKMLDVVEVENEKIIFNKEARAIIKEIAEKTEKTNLYKRCKNSKKREKYIKALSAEEIYEDILNKIISAPTYSICVSSVLMLTVEINKKLENKEV